MFKVRDLLSATSSAVDGFPTGKRRLRTRQTDFRTFGFSCQLVNAGERPQCVVCGDVLIKSNFHARNVCRPIKSKLIFFLINRYSSWKKATRNP